MIARAVSSLATLVAIAANVVFWGGLSLAALLMIGLVLESAVVVVAAIAGA